MTQRHISAATWLKIQNSLGTAMTMIGYGALVVTPLVALGAGLHNGWQSGVFAGISVVAVSVPVMLWLFATIGAIEPLRTDGIPPLER